MALISELETKMTMNNSQFLREIANSGKHVDRFIDTLKGIVGVTAAIYAIKTAFSEVSGWIEDGTNKIVGLEEASKRLGVGVGPLQELQYAAMQAGISQDSLNRSFGMMESIIGQGAPATIKELNKLGLNIDDLKKMKPEDMFKTIGTAIGGMKDQTEKASAAKLLFSRAGIQDLSLFNRDIGALTREFKTFGGELTGPQASAVKSYAESLKKLGAIWDAFKIQLTVAVAGPFKSVIDAITQTIIKMGGVGAAARLAASYIITGVQGAVSVFQYLLSSIDGAIIKFEQLLKIVLRLQQVGTLGLSDLLSNSSGKIDALSKEIEERKASMATRSTAVDQIGKGLSGLNAQIGQSSNTATQRVEVTVTAGDGLKASVAESPEVKAKVIHLMNNIMSGSASGVSK